MGRQRRAAWRFFTCSATQSAPFHGSLQALYHGRGQKVDRARGILYKNDIGQPVDGVFFGDFWQELCSIRSCHSRSVRRRNVPPGSGRLFFMPIEFPCHHSHIVAWAPYTAQPRVCRKISVFVFFGPENQPHVMDDTSKTVFQKDFHKPVQRHGTSARGCRTKRTEHRIHRGRRPSGLSAPA